MSEASGIHLAQPPSQGRPNFKVDQVAQILYSSVLKISKDRDFTTPLHNTFRCLRTYARNCFFSFYPVRTCHTCCQFLFFCSASSVFFITSLSVVDDSALQSHRFCEGVGKFYSSSGQGTVWSWWRCPCQCENDTSLPSPLQSEFYFCRISYNHLILIFQEENLRLSFQNALESSDCFSSWYCFSHLWRTYFYFSLSLLLHSDSI